MSMQWQRKGQKCWQQSVGWNGERHFISWYWHRVTSLRRQQHPVIDCNSENSNCSWEAIDDRNPAFPVLWVPDHAITRCQSCQIEFWLGRRRHHCRSCGQIFCGDCSQYFAPFPKESFLEPVRLCGSCFQSVGWSFQKEKSILTKRSNL